MKTKIYYIILTAVLSSVSMHAFAGGVKGKKVITANKSAAVNYVITSAKEAGMELESWMTNLAEFNRNSERFIESPLEMEGWMMNNFIDNSNTDYFQEEELDLEDWMLRSFEVKSQDNFTDEEFELEAWMLEIL